MKISQEAMDIIFDEARTHTYFEKTEISDDWIVQLYDTLKMAPTLANCQAGRFVFIRSPEAKERLLPHVDESNKRKIKEAAATVIIAEDTRFYENISRLYPRGNYETVFLENEAFSKTVAYQNSCFQGAYLIIAARALGLDCGPMGGFDKKGVDDEFFKDGRWKSNFLCNLGAGDKSKLHPRDERLNFKEACQIL